MKNTILGLVVLALFLIGASIWSVDMEEYHALDPRLQSEPVGVSEALYTQTEEEELGPLSAKCQSLVTFVVEAHDYKDRGVEKETFLQGLSLSSLSRRDKARLILILELVYNPYYSEQDTIQLIHDNCELE